MTSSLLETWSDEQNYVAPIILLGLIREFVSTFFYMEHERFHVTYVKLPEILQRHFFLAICFLGN